MFGDVAVDMLFVVRYVLIEVIIFDAFLPAPIQFVLFEVICSSEVELGLSVSDDKDIIVIIGFVFGLSFHCIIYVW